MVNELIKKYIEKIANGTYEDVYTILDDNCYVNRELLTKEFLQDLEELKKTQLQNLNEVKEYLGSQKITPEMAAIAMRKIEISILGE